MVQCLREHTTGVGEVMTDIDVIAKYNGKRIRIDGKLFQIEVTVGSRIFVELTRMAGIPWSMSNQTYADYPKYVDGTDLQKHACDRAHRIANEIEDNLGADIET